MRFALPQELQGLLVPVRAQRARPARALLACLLAGGHWFAMMGALALLPGLRSIRAVHTVTGRALNAELAATGKTLLIFSMLFSAGWLL